jgi:hypothetical protein
MHISDLDPFPTPQVLYTCFRLKTPLCAVWSFLLLEAPAGVLSRFWVQVQVVVSLLKTPCSGFGREAAVT